MGPAAAYNQNMILHSYQDVVPCGLKNVGLHDSITVPLQVTLDSGLVNQAKKTSGRHLWAVCEATVAVIRGP